LSLLYIIGDFNLFGGLLLKLSMCLTLLNLDAILELQLALNVIQSLLLNAGSSLDTSDLGDS